MSDDRVGGPVPRSPVPVDRRHRILERVAEEQTIHVGELARELGVSEMTIRRDIRRLERDGFLRQTYGGATAHLTRSLDVAFNARALQHAREKRRIGIRASRLLGTASTIYLGIGTTTEQFARYLPASTELTIVTPALTTASLLGTRPIRVVALGGTVRRDDLTVTGAIPVGMLQTYRFDLAVIGAAGLSARWGLTELNDDEAAVQRAALVRSERIMVLADGSKIGTATMAIVAAAELVSVLVTDPSAPAAELAALRAGGTEVVIASPAEPDGPGPSGPRSAAEGGPSPRRSGRRRAAAATTSATAVRGAGPPRTRSD